MTKKYTVTDGKLVLVLEPAEKGWYAVTSPFDPGLTTQAKSVEQAFSMAYDALKCLRAARAELARSSGEAPSNRTRRSSLVDTSSAARRSRTPKATLRNKTKADLPADVSAPQTSDSVTRRQRPLILDDDEENG